MRTSTRQYKRDRAISCCLTMALFLAAGSMGCAHQTVIHTVPEGAEVNVDGESQGPAPVVVERLPGTFGEMTITAKMEEFEERNISLEQDDWFLWPAIIAVTPLLAIPLPLFSTLLLLPPLTPIGLVVVPIAAGACGAWGLVTSPTLLALGFLRTFPDEITLDLQPKIDSQTGIILPTDGWVVPTDYDPNPLPLDLPDSSEGETSQGEPDDIDPPASEVPALSPDGRTPQLH